MVEINRRGVLTNHEAGKNLNLSHIQLFDLECLAVIGGTLHGTWNPNYRWQHLT